MKRICLLLTLLALLLTGCGNEEPTTVATISPGPTAVTVNSVDGLLDAIGHYTEITLEAGYYDLSTASDYGTETDNPYYMWVDIGDGYQLVIQNVDMLTILGEGKEATKVVHTPRYANVLVFQNCTNVTLENFTAGHTDGGECAGGVIHLKDCEEILLNNLGLYGCGTTGVRADSCKNVAVHYSEIYDCSSNAIQGSPFPMTLSTPTTACAALTAYSVQPASFTTG